MKSLIINFAALFGIGFTYRYPKTHVPHTGHVLLSMAASLFIKKKDLPDDIHIHGPHRCRHFPDIGKTETEISNPWKKN
jgi:hypothetical protein